MSRSNWWGAAATVVAVLAALGLFLLLDDDVPELPYSVGTMNVTAESSDLTPAEVAAAQRWSDAFDGAGATVRFYGATDAGVGLKRATVVAVAADAGPLLPDAGFDDRVERTGDDDVDCLAFHGRGKKSDTVDSVTCQRTSGSLTVRVMAPGPDPAAVVDLVDAVWRTLD